MNKNGEFNWFLFVICIIIGTVVTMVFIAIDNKNNSEMGKYERICEKKGMEYFEHHNIDWTANIMVICLDDEGTQVEVELK